MARKPLAATRQLVSVRRLTNTTMELQTFWVGLGGGGRTKCFDLCYRMDTRYSTVRLSFGKLQLLVPSGMMAIVVSRQHLSRIFIRSKKKEDERTNP